MSKSSSRLAQTTAELITEILAISESWSAERVAEADAALQGRSAISLSEMRFMRSKELRAILKRGAIRSAHEYELVMAAVADFPTLFDEQQLAALEQALADFES